MPTNSTSRKLYHVLCYIFKRMKEVSANEDYAEMFSLCEAGAIIARTRDEALGNRE